MSIKPLYDNIVVKLSKQEGTTASGIIIPDSAKKEQPSKGEVVAVGEGKLLVSGEIKELKVKVGDVVIFKSYAPSEIPDEDELVIISESDVLGVIEN